MITIHIHVCSAEPTGDVVYKDRTEKKKRKTVAELLDHMILEIIKCGEKPPFAVKIATDTARTMVNDITSDGYFVFQDESIWKPAQYSYSS
jgi:hypothetical protein